MASKRTVGNRRPRTEIDPSEEDVREIVMEALLQLHVDFIALGGLDEAGPLLQRLMELAYHSTAAPTVANTSGGKRLPKPAMN